ncbi:AbrB/MazE/SpoVT family DNA-binding domain-containing protein [Pseudomonas sp. Pseusp88]|uniref:AbrB/MazE/SpoVT family DNA-binding domain-containing protein n=1 Tax=Pseudomonas sp. Pseusp88 TaxID=3243061 RepID=UPI0039A4ECB1
MHKTNLRKVGGSIMLVVPPAFLDQLHLQAGSTVSLAIEDGRLVLTPKTRPGYTLAELLAAADYSQPQSVKGREWLDAPAVVGELILGPVMGAR